MESRWVRILFRFPDTSMGGIMLIGTEMPEIETSKVRSAVHTLTQLINNKSQTLSINWSRGGQPKSRYTLNDSTWLLDDLNEKSFWEKNGKTGLPQKRKIIKYSISWFFEYELKSARLNKMQIHTQWLELATGWPKQKDFLRKKWKNSFTPKTKII